MGSLPATSSDSDSGVTGVSGGDLSKTAGRGQGVSVQEGLRAEFGREPGQRPFVSAERTVFSDGRLETLAHSGKRGEWQEAKENAEGGQLGSGSGESLGASVMGRSGGQASL